MTSLHVAVASLHVVLGHAGSSLLYRLRFRRSPLVVYRAPPSPHRTWSRIAGLGALAWATALCATTYAPGFARQRLAVALLAVPAPVAWAVALGGLALMVIAQADMGAAFRIGQDERDGPAALREGGLHALCRNPIYVGSWLALAGMTLWHPSPVLVVTCLGAGYAMHRLVRAEEGFLRARFGAAFDAYCARVRRYGVV